MATEIISIPGTTFVSSAQPGNNLSFFPLMYAGTDPAYQHCISLLQIDLPELPVATVNSAILQLAVIVKSGDAPSPITINRVTAPFNPETVTYNTLPAYSATLSQYHVTTSDLYTKVQIDITSIVNDWLNGTYPNYGLALTNSDGTTAVQFATDNIIYEPYFPTLTVTYSVAPPVKTANATNFAYTQLAHVIEQLIQMYPENVMTVFTRGFTASSITGTPSQLYISPEGTGGSIFILLDNGQEAIPLNSITAIYTGDGTVYNPDITYLTPPEFTPGFDADLITAYHDYLPVSTDVQMYLGAIVSASGMLYRNEYGLWVLSDEAGSTPIFIPVLNINSVFPVSQSTLSGKAGSSHVTITNKY